MKYVQIKSTDNLMLDGLILGNIKAKTAYIFIHGLGSSMFSRLDLNNRLANKSKMVLTFNNRGQGIINRFKQEDNKLKKGYKSKLLGSALEKFTNSKHDIQGVVNYLKDLGVESIYLVGHSTGCQKSIYYLAKQDDKAVKGVVLLAPLSDYSSIMNFIDLNTYNKTLKEAVKMKKDKKANNLLPSHLWSTPISAQRFLSLYSPNSTEEIFTYGSKKPATILKKVNKKLLVFLAENDEYSDRGVSNLKVWFERNVNNKSQVFVINDTNHGFQGKEVEVAKIIHQYF